MKFVARGEGYNVFLTGGGAVLDLGRSEGRRARKVGAVARGREAKEAGAPRALLRLRLAGADEGARAAGVSELPGRSNYFLGADPKRWLTDIPTYARVEYKEVYPGIDAVFYGNQRQLEYDFVVAAGADPRAVALEFDGADRVETDAAGDLVLHVGGRRVVQRRPFAYQEVGGVARPVHARYVLKGGRRVAFELGNYDRRQALVIDPVLIYSTYLGGENDDAGLGVAIDSSGRAYVTGLTNSLDFPIVGSLAPAAGGGTDAFVAKLNAGGTALVYSAYLGGGGDDEGTGIAVDLVDSAYVTGTTESFNFPTTGGSLQTGNAGGGDAFVVKLNTTGSALIYSSLLGGAGDDEGSAVAVDDVGAASVTGVTDSVNFPVAKAFQPAKRGGSDAFVSKLNFGGTALSYSTYFGGGGLDWGLGIAPGLDGLVYVTGATDSADFPTSAGAFQRTGGGKGDGFAIKLNTAAQTAPQTLVYSTRLGGNGGDAGFGVAADLTGDAFVAGVTHSTNFPVTAGVARATSAGRADAFVLKLNPTGAGLLYSTYLGGAETDWGLGVGVDPHGHAYVTGLTDSSSFLTAAGSVPTGRVGGEDAFVAKLNTAGSALIYLNALGGTGQDSGARVAVAPAGQAYVTGATRSADFPHTAGALQTSNAGGSDAFAAKFARVFDPNPNLIDGTRFFVRQHYLDFLGREPDEGGLGFWAGNIEPCGTNGRCREVRRVNVSAAFFLSIEFQETGYLVYRLYKAAYGDATADVPGTVPIVRREEFLPDAQGIARGVRVGIGDWQAQLENNKNAFTREFVARPRFLSAYPLTLSAAEFVNRLNQKAGGFLTAAERTQLAAELTAASDVTQGRARVLRRVAEHAVLSRRELNRAFVLMQYYGYMRRNPNDAPDTGWGGWFFWLTKLDENNGDWRRAEMVKAFISSIEYRERFGQ